MKKTNNKKDFKHIATELQNRLVAEGFIVQRYDAYSTKSIYLKLDYGICNSIRISDHVGKKHLNYMFNLGKNIKEVRHERTEFTRYYYPFKKMDELMSHIMRHRANKKRYHGNSYSDVMEHNRQQNQSNWGFWSKAYLVNDEDLRRRFEIAFTVTKEAES